MLTFKTIETLKSYLNALEPNKNIGFVPTMGALHEGHLTLVKQALKDTDIVIAVIYVNPSQFNRLEDFENYPKTLDKDIDLLTNTGCTVLFLPSHEEIYPQGVNNLLINIDFQNITKEMEGHHRPGHFRGVSVIISKLFNIIRPNRAYFGLKDYQQYLVIKYLSEELSFGIQVIGVPTVRQANGLALSSRNLRLSESGKRLAPELYKNLLKAKLMLQEGSNVDHVYTKVLKIFKKSPHFQLDYFQIADAHTLELLNNEGNFFQGTVVIGVAAFLEGIRLIDNILVELPVKIA